MLDIKRIAVPVTVSREISLVLNAAGINVINVITAILTSILLNS